MEKKAQENTGLFHSWQPLPLPPHPALCCFPYLSHKFGAKQWQVSPGLDLVFTEEKSGNPLEFIGMNNGALGFWAGREGPQGGSRARPGDCPGRDQGKRPVVILGVKLSSHPEILHKTTVNSIPFQAQGETSIWNKLLRNFAVSSKLRERNLCCCCLYRM